MMLQAAAPSPAAAPVGEDGPANTVQYCKSNREAWVRRTTAQHFAPESLAYRCLAFRSLQCVGASLSEAFNAVLLDPPF